MITRQTARSCRLAVAALALIGAGAARADGVRTALQHDVFSRPTLSASPATPSAPGETPAPAWRPTLRAIVMAGRHSMVLVDRSVVEMGAQFEGYRLETVDEDRAVFAKGRQRVTLLLGRMKDIE